MRNKIKNNLANIITSIRLFVAVAILIIGFNRPEYWMERTLALFLFGSLTDVADGFVARKFNCVSSLGKLLDPACDKAMLLAMLLVLAVGKVIPMWVFIALAAKEGAMVIGSLFFLNKKIVVMANWYGKLATCLFAVAVAMCVFGWHPYCDWLLVIAVIWAFVAIIQYAVLFYKKLKEAEAK